MEMIEEERDLVNFILANKTVIYLIFSRSRSKKKNKLHITTWYLCSKNSDYTKASNIWQGEKIRYLSQHTLPEYVSKGTTLKTAGLLVTQYPKCLP